MRICDGAGGRRADVVRVRSGSSDQIDDSVPIAVANSGLLDLDGSEETVGPLTLNGGELLLTYGKLTMGGNISVTASSLATNDYGELFLPATRTITVADGAFFDLAAPVTGAGGLTKARSGLLQLSRNFYNGLTVVQQGILQPRHSDSFGSPGSGTVVSNHLNDRHANQSVWSF